MEAAEPVVAPSSRKKTLEQTYQKKTQHEHILARPEMYIGSCERIVDEVWIYDEVTGSMIQRKCSWIPGLYKIFDEILVNSADNKIRDPKGQTQVQVDIDRETGRVRVWNNGEGIPVKKHKEHNLWIPEMIFGHLLTSSNYDDEEMKVTGGRNGFGAKLTNVFSRKFVVETSHHASRRRFKMTWKNNMTQHEESHIEPDSGEDFTCVTFWPDFSKFGMESMENDIYDIMCRRVYDLAGVTDPSLRVRLNGTMLKIRNFASYVDLYPTFGEEKNDKSFSKINDRWEVCVRISNIGYQQVSFVNSIATSRGGNHVKYIVDQIVEKVIESAKKKAKGTEVKAHMIKPHIFVFINCLIVNPSFDSQTKETLNTTKPNFGSKCVLPNSMVDYILKAGLLNRSVEAANSKLTKQMAAKARAGSGRVTGIPKLEDANDAGGKHSGDCTLILTEGDSAKALAVSGLGTIGRDKFGVFPLRGKPLNVRDAGMKKVMGCEEIQAIMKIMGIKIGTQYTSADGLRYGHIMVMSDQDQDGSHIKGLIVNFIHSFWPSLARLPGFLTQFITPIVKAFAKRSGEVKSFFALNAFLEWRRSLSDVEKKNWTFKYYKGLGTSTSKEGKEYFSNLRDHKIDFLYVPDGEDDKQIVLAFGKDKADERKRWIQDYKASSQEQLDYRIKRMRYKDFIDKELIQFSIADCERSIPSLVDGLKPGQRKILYCCFKRNLRSSIKVAQLAGYVSEHAAYHHGEASLQATIVGLAQDYVGANNVPLLFPDGQFGTRLQGGKDCASARYIFTRLCGAARLLYPKTDDDLLEYKDDDGFPVEPHHYVPILPVVLINGTTGIGTGFATSIPNHNPWDVLQNIRNLMAGRDLIPMVPWYYGFQGTIVEREPGKYNSVGTYRVTNDMLVQVRELPIGYWTGQYKQHLEELMQKEFVLTFREHHTDTTVDFDIVLHPEVLRTWAEKGILEERLDLRGSIPASNLMCFDENGKLTKYADAHAILKAFYIIRLEFYSKRKELLLKKYRDFCEKLRNMVRFIKEIIDGSLVVSKKKKPILLQELRKKNYRAFPVESASGAKKGQALSQVDESKEDEDTLLRVAESSADVSESPEVLQGTKDYDYLFSMKLWSLTIERVSALEAQLASVLQQIKELEVKSAKDLWEEDLIKLEQGLKEYFAGREKENLEAIRKLKTRKTYDTTRIRVPVLSDTARRALLKDSEAAERKLAIRKPKRLKEESERNSISFDESRQSAPKASKRTLEKGKGNNKTVKPRRQRKSFWSESSESLAYSLSSETGSEYSVETSEAGTDSDDVPLGVMGRRRPTAKNQNKAAASKVQVPEPTEFDLDAFGVDALDTRDVPSSIDQSQKRINTRKIDAGPKNRKERPENITKNERKKPKKYLHSDDDEQSSSTIDFSTSSGEDDYDSSTEADSDYREKPKKNSQIRKPVVQKPRMKAIDNLSSTTTTSVDVPRPKGEEKMQKGKENFLDDDDFDFL